MRVLLRDLTPGQNYAMQFRSFDGVNSSAWSPVYRFTTDGDVTAPGNPTNVTWVPTGASFIASWDRPTTDGNGGPLRDFRDYQITVSASGKTRIYYTSNQTFEFTLVMNAEAFGVIELEVTIVIKSRDTTGNLSSGVTKVAVEETPPVPSTPIISTNMGLVAVEWDGNTSVGTINPLNLAYIEVHASTTNNFTPSATTIKGRLEGTSRQRAILDNLTYGTLHYFKLVSVNRKGKKSDPSAQASGTPTRISGLDIQNGTISTDQINFVDRLDGVRAYYQTEAPTGAKTNDIWYDTNDNYKTYRYNGSSWIAAPEIGVIAGSKIITGTLTSDAVGTNLLITAAANIANAVIDSAKIASLSAAKISTGTLSADVVMAGRFATALSGARVEINSLGLQKFNSAGDLTVSITGTEALITGVYKSAATGRRIEMGVAGQTGEITFYSPDNEASKIRAYSTEVGGGLEVIAMGIPKPDAFGAWGFLQTQENGLSILMNDHVHVTVGGGPGGTFKVAYSSDRGNSTTLPVSKDRLYIDNTSFQLLDNTRIRIAVDTGFAYWDAAGINRILLDTTSTNFYGANGAQRLAFTADDFHIKDKNGIAVMHHNIADLAVRFYPAGPAGTWGWIEIKNNGQVFGESPNFRLMTPGGHGITFKSYNDNRGTWAEVRAWDDSSFHGIRASAFEVNSDERGKEDIQDVQIDGLALVKAIRPRTFRRKGTDNVLMETGLIAQEAPSFIVNGAPDTGMGVDTIKWLLILSRSIQQLAERIDKLEAKK